MFTNSRNLGIRVSPENCLHDEQVSIEVTGLKANKPYTLALFAKDGKEVPFHTVAHYKLVQYMIVF